MAMLFNVSDYQSCLKLDPNNEEAKTELAQLEEVR